MGCFNFERVKVWIFKLLERWFKLTVWDDDSIPKLNAFAKYVVICSEPTVWDGDENLDTNTLIIAMGSKPTVWDGDIPVE